MWKAWTLHMFWPQIRHLPADFFKWYHRSIQPWQMKMSAWNHHFSPTTWPQSVAILDWRSSLKSCVSGGWRLSFCEALGRCFFSPPRRCRRRLEPQQVPPVSMEFQSLPMLVLELGIWRICWSGKETERMGKNHMKKNRWKTLSLRIRFIYISISIWSMYQSMHLAISTLSTCYLIYLLFIFFLFPSSTSSC